MHDASSEFSRWPRPADTGAADRLAERFKALGKAESRFAATQVGQAVLAALGGNAPYLADLAIAESAILLSVIANGPEAAVTAGLARLRQAKPGATRHETAALLRVEKRRAALAIAIADIGGAWSLTRITAALSELATESLRVAVRFLLRASHQTGSIRLINTKDPEFACGFTALALGKLGAAELNYSSDIDLVLLYDPESPVYPPEAQPVMARFARDLVSLLSARDENGYVFRVDLRLRPDPSATPPVVALPAALGYYESHGRTWERAAFSKARPVAGDIALGERFLTAIRPFIWRKHLDFAAIADIHGMKRQIDARQAPDGILGHDVKLGRGGIREIEFIVQTLSLVWGGQDAALQIPQTLRALPALARALHLPEPAARALAADYRTLRRVEHRLQMVADRQTHALPATRQGLKDFSVFLDDPGFIETFPKLLERVHGHFASLFDAGSAPAGAPVIDPGNRGPAPPAFTQYLASLGYKDAQHVAERLRNWASGTIPALRSERAQGLLEALLPKILEALAGQKEPDRAFILFDTLLTRQRAGVQLLSLFLRNTALLGRLAAVLGGAPALAEHLARDPQALEALLAPTARFVAPRPLLKLLLKDAADLEQAVNITRRFVRQEDFHLSVATLEGRLNADEAGGWRSQLAAAALSALLPRVLRQHVARYGRVKGAQFGVVALGKAGGGEMLAGSDLDLLLVYDHADVNSAPTPYFVRLSHALTGALTAQGPEGPIYHVDMRLRPSGNQGPVAVSLAAFRRYHAAHDAGGTAWTWERMALTRATVLAATPKFASVLDAAILAALERPEPPEKIRADTVAMLKRINTERPPAGAWDVKHCTGGMIELAFIAEALQLIHGPANPALFQANTATALRGLQTLPHDTSPLARESGAALLRADFLWRTVQGIARITGLKETDATPPAAMLAPLLRATGAIDREDLTATMDRARADVRACFIRYIGNIATGD